MKKFLLLLVAVIGFTLSANAQTSSCKIANPSETGATVVGQIDYVDDDGYAHLSFSSDESRLRVNVEYAVTYSNPRESGTKRGNVGVGPNQTASAKIYVGKNAKTSKLTITGARCQQ